MAKTDAPSKMDDTAPDLAEDQVTDSPKAEDTAAPDIIQDAEIIDETPAGDAPRDVASNEPAQDARRPAGFGALVLGGLVAGGIGYGAAVYLPDLIGGTQPDPLAPVISAQSELQGDVRRLTDGLSALADRPQAPDLSADIENLSAQMHGLSDQIVTLQASAIQNADRITVLEKRPLAEVVAPDAIAAYNAELDALRSSVAAELAAVTAVSDAAKAEITAAKDQAAALELSAQNAARRGAAQSALNAIAASLAAGGGYADSLAVLQDNSDLDLPAVLLDNAADGVATQAALIEQFPDLSRAALAAARTETPAQEGESGIGAFLRTQLNVRSLTPQEGSSPDAILSRAEAAVKAGDVAAGLIELQGLPGAAIDVLAPWIADTTARAQAQQAAADLSTQLTQN